MQFCDLRTLQLILWFLHALLLHLHNGKYPVIIGRSYYVKLCEANSCYFWTPTEFIARNFLSTL